MVETDRSASKPRFSLLQLCCLGQVTSSSPQLPQLQNGAIITYLAGPREDEMGRFM